MDIGFCYPPSESVFSWLLTYLRYKARKSHENKKKGAITFMDEHILSAISTVGFPIVVSCYLLVKF